MRRGLLLAAVLAAAMAVALPVRAALDSESQQAVEAARDSRDNRVFWLGERFRSQELTSASREERKGRAWFAFIYGDCEPEPDSGCSPPYQLQNYSACSRNLASYGAGVHPKRRKSIRGAAVYEFGDGGTFDMLEVYTGRTTIAIWAPTAAKARRVVRYLEGINVDVGRDDPLGPPAKGALSGKLRCG